MGCLDCSAIQLSGKVISCQHSLPLELHNIWNPEDCPKGKRENNYFGKTYGMKTMISFVLSTVGNSLSKEERVQIEQQESITQQILYTIFLYERMIESFGIEKPEQKDLLTGQSCYECIHSSTTKDNLFIQCCYYHNDIGEKLAGCESIKQEWKKSEQLIRKVGLNTFLDLVLHYNSSLWLYVNEDTTAGDKWVAILGTYEKTLREKTYRVQKLNRMRKPIIKELSLEEMLERVKVREPSKPSLEDDIVY